MPLQHRKVLFAVFCEAEPPRRVDCCPHDDKRRLKDTRGAISSAVEPKFRTLSITSPALYQLSCAAALAGLFATLSFERLGVVFSTAGHNKLVISLKS